MPISTAFTAVENRYPPAGVPVWYESHKLRAGMRQLRDELTADWQRRLAELKSLLESADKAGNIEART